MHIKMGVKTSIILLGGMLLLIAGCSGEKPRTATAPPQYAVVYVDGEVQRHGAIAWTNGMTLQDAINAAGGFTDFAPRHVRLIHPDGSFQKYGRNSQGILTKNPALQPGDRIFVPRVLF